MPVTHAVIPAAGRGTRMLTVTRAVPKELLPLGPRALIDHVVDEVRSAGIGQIVVVSSRAKPMLNDHLNDVRIVYQAEPRGLGDAVLCAETLVEEGAFAVALGDTLVEGAVLRLLVEAVDEGGLDGAIAVERVPPERAGSYGVVAVGDDSLVTGLVEKPAPGDAPSDLAVAARYVLPPEIFAALREAPPGTDGEVGLTDTIDALVRAGARIAAVPLPHGGRRWDVGSPAGYAAAREAFAAHGDG